MIRYHLILRGCEVTPSTVMIHNLMLDIFMIGPRDWISKPVSETGFSEAPGTFLSLGIRASVMRPLLVADLELSLGSFGIGAMCRGDVAAAAALYHAVMISPTSLIRVSHVCTLSSKSSGRVPRTRVPPARLFVVIAMWTRSSIVTSMTCLPFMSLHEAS